jgi:polyphosphate kinase
VRSCREVRRALHRINDRTAAHRSDRISPAGPASSETGEGNPDRFVNREFSWLQFNRRVLEESQNDNHPLLERVRFLSISAANLDEFFMVRVAGLAGQVRARASPVKSADGRTPEQQLEQLLVEGAVCRPTSKQPVRPDGLLKNGGHRSITRRRLTKDERDWLEGAFPRAIFPVLTPLSIDPAHPFPFIPNLGFSMALQLAAATDARR